MKKKESRTRFFTLRPSDKLVLCLIAVMVLVIIVLSIMQRAGLSLIRGELMVFLPFLALAVLVGWGAVALLRLIRNRTAKTIVSAVVILALVVVAALAFLYVSFMTTITVPQRYATLTSPNGTHKLVVLRTLDPDTDRIEARRAARLANDPDGSQEIIAADWGYIYRPYPVAMGVFYRNNANLDGEVYLTYDGAMAADEGTEAADTDTTAESEATSSTDDTAEPAAAEDAANAQIVRRGTLMMEWLDENTVHFFVQDPGVSEGGECTLSFE